VSWQSLLAIEGDDHPADRESDPRDDEREVTRDCVLGGPRGAGRVRDARIERGESLARDQEEREADGHQDGARRHDPRVPSRWVRDALIVTHVLPRQERENGREHEASQAQTRDPLSRAVNEWVGGWLLD